MHEDLDSLSDGDIVYEEGPTDLDRAIAAKIKRDTKGRILLTPLGAIYTEASGASPGAAVQPNTPGRGTDQASPETASGAATAPGMGAIVGLPITDGENQGQNGESAPSGTPPAQESAERLFEARIMLPEIYAWKIYAGTVSDSYLENIEAQTESDGPNLQSARHELSILRNYFRQMPDDMWDRAYSSAKFEPKNHMIATGDGHLDARTPEISPIPGHDAMRSWWLSNLKTLPGWMNSMGIDAAGCRMVEEAMQKYRQERNIWEKTNKPVHAYAGQYTNPIAIAIDKVIQGLPSDSRKERVKNTIMSQHGVMRFNQKYPHNIKDMLRRRLLTKRLFLKTKMAMTISTQNETIGEIDCNVSYITHIVFEVPDNEFIKDGMRESWGEIAESQGEQSELEFPESTITQNETSGDRDTWVITPLSVDIGRIVVETINNNITAVQNTNTPVLIRPSEQIKKGDEVPEEIKKANTWGAVFEKFAEQYDSMLSANSVYSAELMWIFEIAKDIAGLSRRMDELTMMSLASTRDEAGGGSNNLWHMKPAGSTTGEVFRLSPTHEKYERMINRSVQRGRKK